MGRTRFYQDPDSGRLYISTSDLQSPETHTYTLAVTDQHGFYLEAPKRVVIDGLAATAFNSVAPTARYPGYQVRWGIIIGSGYRCVIRNATTFLNGGGICLHTGEDGQGNLIDSCVAYANYANRGNGGNILAYSPNQDVIRNSYSYRTRLNGIRFYGGHREGNTHEGNIAWGSGWSDLNTKAAVGPVKNSIALGAGNVLDTRNCLIGGVNSKHFTRDTPLDTIRFLEEDGLDPVAEFADPDNLDFRLQATSRFRGTGPDGRDRGPFPYQENIYFVSAEGDDSHDGLSIDQAWKTVAHAADQLKAGDTLYLEPGVYDGSLSLSTTGPEPIRIRARGTEPAVLLQPVQVAAEGNVEFERLRFLAPVEIQKANEVVFNNCLFADAETGLQIGNAESLRVTHCSFTGFETAAVHLENVGQAVLRGNIFDNRHGPAIVTADAGPNLYSDYNSYNDPAQAWLMDGTTRSLADLTEEGSERFSHEIVPDFVLTANKVELANPEDFQAGGPLGTPLGFYREHEFREKSATIAAGPQLHSVTPTTANLEWWAAGRASYQIKWSTPGESEEMIAIDGRGFTTYSLRGLTPGATYEVEIKAAIRQEGEELADFSAVDPVSLSVTTPTEGTAPATYHVSPQGDDSAAGDTPATAWRTIAHAADRVRPGDTVLIQEGLYEESVHFRATGDADTPITFRAMPGQRVELNGMNRSLPGALHIQGKGHLHFDGLYLNDYSGRAMVQVNASDDIQFTRCFFDGRGRGNAPWIMRLEESGDLLIQNCVLLGGFSGIHVTNCPELRVENNVFYRNWILDATIYNEPDEKCYLRFNIFTDNLVDKVAVYLFEVAYQEAIVEESNAFFLRVPEEEKDIFLFIDNVGDPMHTRNRMERVGIMEYVEKYGRPGSLVADPKFPALEGIEIDPDATDRQGNPLFIMDRLPNQARDFADFFTTNPELIERGIGLDPSVFPDEL